MDKDGAEQLAKSGASRKKRKSGDDGVKAKGPDELSYRVVLTPTAKALMGKHFKKPDTVVMTLAHHLQKSEASQTMLTAMSEVLFMAKSNPLNPPDKWRSIETKLIDGIAVD